MRRPDRPAALIWNCDRCGRLSAAAPPAGTVCACCGGGAWSRRLAPPPAGDPTICRHGDHEHAWPPDRPPIWLWRAAPFRACGLCGRLPPPGGPRRQAACSCGGLLIDHVVDLPASVVLAKDGPRSLGLYAAGLLDAAAAPAAPRLSLRAVLDMADRLAGRVPAQGGGR